MAVSFGIFAAFILYQILSFALCQNNTERFVRKSVIDGKICFSEDITFSKQTPTKMTCMDACSKDPDCKSAFYNQEDLICTGCTQQYHVSSNLEDQPGNIYYVSGVIDCGPPITSNPHVVIESFGGNTLYGTRVGYTCIPCTYFPLTASAEITCQANGTWSKPTCVFGSDVGYLSNGSPIPETAAGCVSVNNVTCSESGVANGFSLLETYTGCMCDKICCQENDCCFDHDCIDIST